LWYKAQVNTGRILGTVTDQSGGVIAGATVTVTNSETNVGRTLTTDEAGAYTAPNLNPGTYTVGGTSTGFQTLERQNIALGVGVDARVDVQLSTGQVTQTIEVTAATPMVDTARAVVSGTSKCSKPNKPTQGFTSVGARDTNDPANLYCDLLGFPREDRYNLKGLQIVQTQNEVLMLYEYDQAWRTIWTDEIFPRIITNTLEPRWYGYSIGKWVDDTTLVVETVGTDERTLIDNGGRPHSDELRVEERFHRVNHDILQLTVTINDPKIYTKPWLALDKFPMRLQPPDFDIREMICSPSELADYLKQVGNLEGGPTGEGYPFSGR